MKGFELLWKVVFMAENLVFHFRTADAVGKMTVKLK